MPPSWTHVAPLEVPGTRHGNTRTVASNTTVTTSDYMVRVDATAGARTITLPPAASCYNAELQRGQIFEVRSVSNSAHQVTVTPVNSEIIADGATYPLHAGDSVTLQSYGAGWDVL